MGRSDTTVKVVLTASITLVALAVLQGTTSLARVAPEQEWKIVRQTIDRDAASGAHPNADQYRKFAGPMVCAGCTGRNVAPHTPGTKHFNYKSSTSLAAPKSGPPSPSVHLHLTPPPTPKIR
jgi:hypothetical protein